ncbi:MAG TPA: allantoinase AllB [Candidatus Dormibacteraeota bacterium]|nr:allantoinase AllB [Candidatus Dormibacteraeota bacterium]
MADADLVVRNGTVVLPEEVVSACDVAVIGGRIGGIGPYLRVTADTEIDAGGLHVFPGGVDPHVHFNQPGRTDWEGLATGSQSLAQGGFTTYVDMPLNSSPVTVDEEAFELKLRAANAWSLVDFGFWGGLVPGKLRHVEVLARKGVLGFKAFMCDSGIAEFPAADDMTLCEGMRRCADVGLPVLVHAENTALVSELARRMVASGHVGPRDFAASRPVIAEVEAITRALFFASETGCAVHVVHVSIARGVQLVEQARASGLDASCETCPHYLLLSEADFDELGGVAKCAPPLRSASDRDALWELISQGRLRIVASDHSPCPPELKQGSDFFAVWGGISGCQTTLQLLLAHGHGGRGVGLPTVAGLTGGNAARRFRLDCKGAIEVGNDADLVLLDLSQEWPLSAHELGYRHPHSPFVGWPLRGRVVRTLLRGRTVVADGHVVSQPAGRLVTRAT